MKAKQTIVSLFFSLACLQVFAQPPLVYTTENTGTSCTAPALPALADLPVIQPLPDPFMWANGSGRSTNFSDWECRRNEIKAQIEHYEIGTKPPRPDNITASYAPGTNGGVLTVVVTNNGQTLTLTSQVALPSGSGPFPAVIGMNSLSGSIPASVFTSKNIARITFNHNNVTTYGGPQNTDPFYKLYPDQNIDNAGQYSAWAWGVSRLIDGLELVQADLPIDLSHLGVTGCSYAGKMALFAGAFDERIALTIAQESGGGGAPAWRVSHSIEPNGSVEKIDNTDYNWFKEDMRQFSGDNVYKLPEDHHELMAMVAPRALLITGNTDYTWLSNKAAYVSARAAKQVYSTLGISDRMGFYIDGGHGHCAVPNSQLPAIQAFVDKFLAGDASVITDTVTVNPFPTLDYQRWYQWWGTGDPILPPPPPEPISKKIWLEAECAKVGSRWVFGSDTAASNGKYVMVRDGLNSTAAAPTGDSSLLYFTFNVDSAATYSIRARVNCPTANDDSYWVKVDNGTYVNANGLNGTGWQWVVLTTANLAVGPHTLTIGYREDGAKLDKILATTSEYATTGKGDTVVNCGMGQIPLVYGAENTATACAAPVLPTFDQLPFINPLPDPFMWSNNSGRSINFTDWECRRNEIKAEIENYEIGTKPNKPENITATYTPGANPAAGGTLSVVVTVNGKSLTLTSAVSLPSGEGATGPFPAIIGMNSPTGGVPDSLFDNRKIAKITYNHNNVTTYGNPGLSNPYYQLYPDQNLDNAGQYSAWAWGVSRLIDGLELVQASLPIDLNHLGVAGCSYAGKMALFAGALDERIALTLPLESGGGGAPAWRVSETSVNIERLGGTDDKWFKNDMWRFSGLNTSKLPEDHHELMAMVAPRALLATSNTDFDNLSSKSAYVSARATKIVYNTFGIGDRFGFIIDGGHGHCAIPASQIPYIRSFIDKFLVGTADVNTTDVAVNPFPDVDYQRWTNWWGTNNAVFPDEDPNPVNIWLEAECGIVGSKWNRGSDAEASNGNFVTGTGPSVTSAAPTDTASAVILTFNVEREGIYNFIGRTNSPGPTSDSYWFKVDNGPFQNYNGTYSVGYQWVRIISDVPLSVGEHTLTLTFREQGSKLDKVLVTTSNTSFSGTGDVATNCGTLPVNLVNYNAALMPGGEVLLSWNTSAELNNKMYRLERSQDGRSFSPIGSVAGRGTLTASSSYTFTDTKPYKGVNYYRLIQVGIDGHELSLGVRTINLTGKPLVRVFPNPAHSKINIDLGTGENSQQQVRIYNTAGKLVYSRLLSVANGIINVNLEQQQSAGVYLVKIGDNSQVSIMLK